MFVVVSQLAVWGLASSSCDARPSAYCGLPRDFEGE